MYRESRLIRATGNKFAVQHVPGVPPSLGVIYRVQVPNGIVSKLLRFVFSGIPAVFTRIDKMAHGVIE